MDYAYHYRYDFPSGTVNVNGNETVIGAIIVVCMIAVTLAVIVALLSYIFHSVGLYTIGKRLGKKYLWLAFIPYARDYFHGQLAGEIRLKNQIIKNPGLWKLLFPIICSVVLTIFFAVLTMIFGIGASVGMGSAVSGIFIIALIIAYVVLAVIAVLFSAVIMVLNILVNIQIFAMFTTYNMAVVHAVLSQIIPLYEPVCMFVMRSRPFIADAGIMEQHMSLNKPVSPVSEETSEDEADPQETDLSDMDLKE